MARSYQLIRSCVTIALLTALVSGCAALLTDDPTGHASVLAAPSPVVYSLPDPCTLLTSAEVATVLGATLQDPVVEREMLDAECSFSTRADPNRSVLIQVTAAWSDGTSFAKRVQFFEGQGAHPVAGLGLAAYAKGGTVLVLLKYYVLFIIFVDQRLDDQAAFASAQVLLNQAMTRLPY